MAGNTLWSGITKSQGPQLEFDSHGQRRRRDYYLSNDHKLECIIGGDNDNTRRTPTCCMLVDWNGLDWRGGHGEEGGLHINKARPLSLYEWGAFHNDLYNKLDTRNWYKTLLLLPDSIGLANLWLSGHFNTIQNQLADAQNRHSWAAARLTFTRRRRFDNNSVEKINWQNVCS